MRYADFIKVAPRFARSINLERDAALPEAIDGYVLTATAKETLHRLLSALSNLVGHRAWSLTGPYGSGKSAFALYLSNLLRSAESPGGRLARRILKAQSEDIFREFFGRGRKTVSFAHGFLPVLVSGAAEPIIPAIVRACDRGICGRYPKGRLPAPFKQLKKLRAQVEGGKGVATSEVVRALASIASTFQHSRRAQGILLIIDELGKFLEFAAREPERGDIYILQQFAEAAVGFESPGLVVVTILHQSFERYVAGLRPAVRDEWSKVQGRFEDIGFQEPPGEILDLLSRAINQSDQRLARLLRQRARQHAEAVADLGLVPPGMAKSHFIHAMTHCAPLHPLTALILARLCRKFGQNQRSLFSFLVSREPHAFSSFLQLDVNGERLPFYRAPDLYDYVAHAFGNGLSVGENATHWAEVQSALERHVNYSPQELDVIKTVGLLSAIGVYGELKPSKRTLELAFDEDRCLAPRAWESLLQRSILVHRKHTQSFALWQGSDVDIDSRVREAAKHVTEGLSLALKLAELWKPRPVVAKRHSFITGTLRYFAIRFCGASDFHKALDPDPDADGCIIYCLPSSQGEFDQLKQLAAGSAIRERPEVVIAIPCDIGALRESVRELELLRWVQNNTPELKGDAVARRELRARIAAAEARLSKELQTLYSPGIATARTTAWFHRGIVQAIHSGRSLAQFLSDICDTVYEHTPVLRNELINRRTLSSAAAAARRNLIEAMILHGDKAHLSIGGTPPEMSMYASVLEATGIHRLEATGYGFGLPQNDPGLAHVWTAIEAFFVSSELRRRSIAELFSILQKPPFGLKMGVIPVLFCAAILAHDAEVALYENGSFVPELSVEIFERLLRSPDKFEIRRYQVVGVRAEVFHRFAELMGGPSQTKDQNIIAVVRPLYRFFARLPEYTKRSRNLSPVALAVREALLNAREPDVLLFEDLPRACGKEPYLTSTESQPCSMTEFFRTLKIALGELQRAYNDLLTSLQQLVIRAFNADGTQSRGIIRFRATTLAEHAVDPRLRAFIHHLSDEQLDEVAWIEAIATLLAGKSPRTWSDADHARFQVSLTELVRNFRHLEALTFELRRREHLGQYPAEVLRIGVTDRHSKEREAVVAVQTSDLGTVTEATISLEDCLDRLGLSSDPEISLAALAAVARRFLAELDKPRVPDELCKPEELSHE